MDNGELQEMLGMALAAKEAGFPRIQIDPADFIEVADQRNQLLAALKQAYASHEEDFEQPWLSVAAIAIAAAKGAA